MSAARGGIAYIASALHPGTRLGRAHARGLPGHRRIGTHGIASPAFRPAYTGGSPHRNCSEKPSICSKYCTEAATSSVQSTGTAARNITSDMRIPPSVTGTNLPDHLATKIQNDARIIKRMSERVHVIVGVNTTLRVTRRKRFDKSVRERHQTTPGRSGRVSE